MDTIRQLWLNFCCTLESNDDNLKKFMISFSSAVYNTLMHGVQVNITEFTKPTGISSTSATVIKMMSTSVLVELQLLECFIIVTMKSEHVVWRRGTIFH